MATATPAPPDRRTGPVTGQPINWWSFVDTPELDVFFASEEARARWQKDRQPYQKKLDACYTFQNGCATCDADIDPRAFIQDEGRKIYFCCMGRRGRFKTDPKEFLTKLDEQTATNQAAWEKQQAAKNKPGAAKAVKSQP